MLFKKGSCALFLFDNMMLLNLSEHIYQYV